MIFASELLVGLAEIVASALQSESLTVRIFPPLPPAFLFTDVRSESWSKNSSCSLLFPSPVSFQGGAPSLPDLSHS